VLGEACNQKSIVGIPRFNHYDVAAVVAALAIFKADEQIISSRGRERECSPVAARDIGRMAIASVGYGRICRPLHSCD
jgi:hypothetical protein